MSFEKLVEEINSFIENQGGYWSSAWILAALAEELGELSRAIQSYEGLRENNSSTKTNNEKTKVKEECGDLLFALICLTNSLDLDLIKACFNTLNKYKARASPFNDAER